DHEREDDPPLSPRHPPEREQRRKQDPGVGSTEHCKGDATRRVRDLHLEEERVRERDDHHGGQDRFSGDPRRGRFLEQGDDEGAANRDDGGAGELAAWELVQLQGADAGGRANQQGQRNTAPPDQPEHSRQEHQRRDHADDQVAILLAHAWVRSWALVLPKRRSRFWKSSSASSRSSSPKSGQSASVKWISA